MRKEQVSSSMPHHVAASVAASGLVATKVMDCLLQTLMTKELLLPSEVNDIYRAATLLIAQTAAVDQHAKLVQRLAVADLADRLGEG